MRRCQACSKCEFTFKFLLFAAVLRLTHLLHPVDDLAVERFLSKYPDEKGSGVIFVSKSEGPDSKPELEFKGHKMLLNLFADNKPNLSVTPHWTASLHAVWNLDTAELENVEFRPGPIEERPHY